MFHPTFITIFSILLSPLAIAAQTVVNGQIYTGGLSIVDAPQPNTPFHAGANMPIAIDVSGNGRLEPAASIPGSDKSTRFDLLEIFLVSFQTQHNLSVSEGPALLEGERGSTVKHLDFSIKNCVPSGNYNLTFYEHSHINGTQHLAITALPVTIQNTAQSGECSGNQLVEQPQAASGLTQSPWLDAAGAPVTYPVVGGAPTLAALLPVSLIAAAMAVVISTL